MKMNKKAQVIATSVAAIALSSSLIAGSTFALFTSESNVNIAVTSGKVKINAQIENTGSASTLGGDAIGTVETVNGVITLNNITPGDEFIFTVTAENTSTISALYRTKIEVEESELASALEITVGEAEYSALKSYASGWLKLEAGENPAELTIKVALPALEVAQNDLMEKSTTISVILEGVQGNAAYEIGGAPEVDCYVDDVVAALDYEFVGNTCVITGVDKEATEVTVPASVNGNPVTIAENAFKNHTNLKKVTVACAEVPSYAFSGCTSLEEIVLEEGVETLGYHAFGCEEVYVGGGNEAPGEANKLEKIHIADTVKVLTAGAFYGCENLTTVTFGKNSQLTKIVDYAFEGCTSLANITIPETVEIIGCGAFSGCAFESIVLPASVKVIDYGAFSGCTNLKTITIPATLESFGNDNGTQVFALCTNLEEILISGTAEKCATLWNKLQNGAQQYGSMHQFLFGGNYTNNQLDYTAYKNINIVFEGDEELNMTLKNDELLYAPEGFYSEDCFVKPEYSTLSKEPVYDPDCTG